jgi:hypothetical protein
MLIPFVLSTSGKLVRDLLKKQELKGKKTAAFRQLSKSVFKESSKFSFPSRKGTDFKRFSELDFRFFPQDNEGFRDRQHFFFKVLDSVLGLIF